MKVVVNRCYGGFGISVEALEWLRARNWVHASECDVREFCGAKHVGLPFGLSRHDPLLVECVETLGDKANGKYARLAVEWVGGSYEITEYDGLETLRPGSTGYTDEDIAQARAEGASAERAGVLALIKQMLTVERGSEQEHKQRACREKARHQHDDADYWDTAARETYWRIETLLKLQRQIGERKDGGK